MMTFVLFLLAAAVLMAGIRPMTNLDRNSPRAIRGHYETSVHEASAEIFQGSAVQEGASGTLENATGVGTTFMGIALEHARAAGDRIEIVDKGTVELTVAKGSAWAETDKQATVYLTDGNTFTLSSSSAQAIGKVEQVLSGVGTTSATVLVYIEGVHKRSI